MVERDARRSWKREEKKESTTGTESKLQSSGPPLSGRTIVGTKTRRPRDRRISVRCGNNEKRRGGGREREREIGLLPRSTGACILSFRSFFLPSLSFPVDPVAPDLPRRVVEVIKQEIPRHPRGKKKFSFSTTAIFTPSHSDLRNLGCLYSFEFFPISRRHWHESGRRKRNAMENTFWSSIYI